MNTEKLQEFVKQATVKVNNPYIGSGGNVVLDCWEEQLSIELLADLIVKDCVGICDDVQRRYGQYTFTATKVKEEIQQHFGIKE